MRHTSKNPAAEPQIGITKKIDDESMASQTIQIESLIESITKLWIVSLAGFVLLANVPTLFLDGYVWLNDVFCPALLAGGLLYLSLIALRKYQKHSLKNNIQLTPNLSSDVQNQKISKLYFGLIGGLLGICASGVIMWFGTIAANGFPLFLLALCGALSGLGFGLLTKGNRRMRGVIGCAFAVIAILFGLLISYTAPVIVGYSIGLDGELLSPIYIFNTTTFLEYVAQNLFTLNGLFFIYVGLLVAYTGSARPFKT